MRWSKILILFVIAVLMGWGIYGLLREKATLTKNLEALKSNFDALENENKSLTAGIEYFKRPENLLKELKSQFNYREAGEKLIIVVPNATTTR